jgi:charged multivesicular body protein 3
VPCSKEIARSRRARERMMCTKANLNTMEMNLQHQIAESKVLGVLKASSEMMATMNELIKVAEVRETMMGMSKEMAKAEFMQENVQEMFDDLVWPIFQSPYDPISIRALPECSYLQEPEEAEEEQEAVVDAILNEILGEKMAVAGSSPASAPQMAARPAAAAEEEAPAEEEEDDISEMQARIAALRAA